MNTSPPTLKNGQQTQALLPWPALMQAIGQAAREMRQGLIQAPARQAVPFPEGGTLLSMPATAADLGVHKLVNVVTTNRERGLPTIHGMVSVYDGHTGELRLMLDGPTVTTRRTVAVSMLGLSHLLPDGPRHAVIFGTGTQARGHALALCDLYPDVRISIIGRTPAQTESFTAQLGRPRIQATRSVPDSADVVITATTSAVPVYGLPARPGRMLIAVGAYRADLAEIGAATLLGSRLYVDEREGARHEAGDYLQAGVPWERVHDLLDLLDAAPPGEPCVLKTVGCAAWDLAAARCAVAQQRERQGSSS
ncbi:MAG: delta(1)-pyrroline-2-carboxylate reductase family protein [Castellaniella sp.]|uniref:delta(1)-pyrroline-2-carboxylate reductase family protein n=1 Tax=Castellaniella sp. TaxID=1955812 RepID=UPI003A869DF5